MMSSVNVDALLASCGSFGRYQQLLFVLLAIPAGLTALITMASVFTMATPSHRCLIPQCDSDEAPVYSDYTHFKFAMPIDKDDQPDSCVVYHYSNGSSPIGQSSDPISATSDRPLCTPAAFVGSIRESCPNHVFDHAHFDQTLVTHFDLTCNQAWKVPLVTSFYFGGVLIFSPLYGYVADSLGRRPTMLFSLSLTSVATLLSSFASSFAWYVALIFLAGVGQVGVFQTAFILVVESVESEWRVFTGIVIEYFFVLGELLLALLAYHTRQWQMVLRIASLPFFIMAILHTILLPESLRWLVNKGRREQAEKVFDKLLKINGVQETIGIDDFDLDDDLNDDDEVNDGQEGATETNSVQDDVAIVRGSESVLDLITSRTLVLRGANICFCWMVVSMTYFGLSLNSGQLAGDPYINFGMVAVVEIPGYSLSYWSMQKLGRRASVSLSLILGGVSCVISGLVSELNMNLPLLQLLAFLTGKMGVTAAFGTVYLYTSELYPTSLRTLGVGISSMCARLGSIFAPYVTSLATIEPLLPMVVFGLLALLSGLLALLLPETLGKRLPETIHDAIHMGSHCTDIAPNHGDHEDRTQHEDDRDEATRQEEVLSEDDKPLIVA